MKLNKAYIETLIELIIALLLGLVSPLGFFPTLFSNEKKISTLSNLINGSAIATTNWFSLQYQQGFCNISISGKFKMCLVYLMFRNNFDTENF